MDIKLTKADRIILKSLAYNSRILEKELAKRCSLSKDSIRYRTKRLEKLGVIKGYGVFIDYTSLGYQPYKLYLKLNATNQQKEGLIAFLKKQRHVFSIFESYGTWDIGTAIFAKDRMDYYTFETQLLSEFGSIINSKHFCLMLDAVIFNNNLLYEDKNITEYSFWKSEHIETIDEKDKLLLHELHKDSTTNLVKLSRKAHLSIDSVSKRIRRLNDKKIISFYPTTIDYNLLGYEKYKLFISVKNYSVEAERKLFAFLKTQKQTLNIIRIIGSWKLEVEFLIREYAELYNLLSALQEKFSDNILKLEFSIFRNELWFPSEHLLL
ncbi:MAG TPA: winged helix-turn-helix transcriptional regulator [Candidatus Nanoarchaeia archaeon]|nr:winged helix-turn-helix transcriptional regulator [Candidatus Nanoarchaeia archaeon]